MGLTKDCLKTVHYILFNAIYSIIYHFVSFSPDGIQEVDGSISIISTKLISNTYVLYNLRFLCRYFPVEIATALLFVDVPIEIKI